MQKKIKLLYCIIFLFLFIPFFFNTFHYLRMVSIGIGLFLLLFTFYVEKKNLLKLIFFTFFLLIFLYGLDFIKVYYGHSQPIFALSNTSNSNFSTYNSFFYRLYNCNGNSIFDFMYQKNYVCDFRLEERDINAFLSNENYKKEKNHFVTIKGKVSEIIGNTSLSLQAYEQEENHLVGELTFLKNKTVKVMNNHNDLKLYGQYEIYDTVYITARIDEITNDEILLEDAWIVKAQNFDQFTIQTIESKNCKNEIKEISNTTDYHYYSTCLEDIYVHYDEDTIYDIILALETKKLTLEKWIYDVQYDENEISQLYKFPKYRLLKCKENNKILIGTSKLNLKNDFCTVEN